jgi:hypothetical protein
MNSKLKYDNALPPCSSCGLHWGGGWDFVGCTLIPEKHPHHPTLSHFRKMEADLKLRLPSVPSIMISPHFKVVHTKFIHTNFCTSVK